jgi:hypothetical protein
LSLSPDPGSAHLSEGPDRIGRSARSRGNFDTVSQVRLPVLAPAVAVLALLATGCNGGGHRAPGAAAGTPTTLAPCKLDRAQRRTVALALADIRRLQRIQAPVQRFSLRGAPNQEVMTGKFEMDLGSSHLPPDLFAHLLHRAKTAVDLCGDCSNALEAEEPVLGNRGEGRCG